MAKKIVIGADHGGFKLKTKLISYLKKIGYSVDDVGTYSDDPTDYPLFGVKVSEKVSKKKPPEGILICKTGVGMSITANKFPGVRAAVCVSEDDAISSREHNNVNLLVIAATKVTANKAINIVKAWLRAGKPKGRHARRVGEISKLEKRLYNKGR